MKKINYLLPATILLMFLAGCGKETAAPTPVTPVTPVVNATLWEKYSWTKPVTASEIITASTNSFLNYVATIRTPNQVVTVIAQDGVDATLIDWITQGAGLVSKAFAYPVLGKPFIDVIAIDRTWLENTYKSQGFTTQEVNDRLGGWDAGAPAFGGKTTNTWNYSVIRNSNGLVNDKTGMAQTAGHEFFHAIQENLAQKNPGANGLEIPNWFWEGPAMFVGLQTSSKLGFVDYVSIGQKVMITRFSNDPLVMRALPLSEVKGNSATVDPYGIGEVATEFLVAKVGMEKFLDIYKELGKGKTFALAFKDATGVELADFYTMFEEVRATLGVPKA